MGKGVPKDHKAAEKWYRLAAKQGNANAQLNLARLQKKIAKTKNAPTVAAQKSPEPSKSADFQKGLTAAKSGDYATALQHFRPLAKQGNASAQKNIGVMYSMGKGVPKDHKTAVKWYRLAAEQGNADAQYNLGLMYLTGQGVIKDNVYAHMWYNIAASSGDKDAVSKRDIIAGKMTPAQIAKAQDFARECVRKNYKGC
jgi:TPR repeat protein